MPDQPPSQESPLENSTTAVTDSWSLTLLRDAPVGMAIKSSDGRYLWINSAAARLIGAPVEQIRDATDATLFPPPLAARLRRGDTEVLAHHTPIGDEVELSVGESPVFCQVVKFPLSSIRDAHSAFGVAFIDQAAQHREIEALRDALEARDRSNRDLRSALEELERLAGTDKLTTVWNRRRLEEAVADEMHRLERYGNPLSALVLDIDHFKKVNDNHGHAVGDSVLVNLSALVRRRCRRSDSLSRWGGEEFIVLCPHTNLSMATLLAERLRSAIAGASFPVEDRITVSIGVAECVAGETWDQWFRRADDALLRAKRDGRNRVDAAPETVSADPVFNPIAGRFLQLTWRGVYASGHPLIDQQHRMLFEQSNHLLAAALDNRPAMEIELAFEALIAGVQAHFHDEELILRESGYEGVEAHAAIHRELSNSAVALLEKFQAGLLGVGEIFEFLVRDVIAKHLLGADRDFFPDLGARSV